MTYWAQISAKFSFRYYEEIQAITKKFVEEKLDIKLSVASTCAWHEQEEIEKVLSKLADEKH